MANRMTEAELAAFLEGQLPAAGTQISYRDFHAQVRASEHPEALEMYRSLKRAGKVRASLTHNEDGTITHLIERGS